MDEKIESPAPLKPTPTTIIRKKSDKVSWIDPEQLSPTSFFLRTAIQETLALVMLKMSTSK